ncbi:uncharacterized protein FOMMEDRAFT_169392 [Fomitiporia mediterranea MF3/22]|uniref:uncharacterized protein n=1 Tax=Fomitiporia mediterranea (strain MF3/22) TaxID=694068 RepID=UPI000440845C|nr:uncharacterized protein FOMMEDRAFT_169392 [Fomitiporia mediterranea MF3/22]EJD01230.1 hypothetical protein FOMMEDRAFT_169392 [Fomitiporia mediterranea MF3/22]
MTLESDGQPYVTVCMEIEPICLMLPRLRPVVRCSALRSSYLSCVRTSSAQMSKRAHSEDRDGIVDGHRLGNLKKARVQARPLYNKVATAENAAAVDENPPLRILLDAMQNGLENVKKGESVVYWLRMEDLRVVDNRALSLASEQAQSHNIPLLVLFVISPQDYEAHDRGPRRIDFMLRNVKVIQDDLDKLHIPLYIVTVEPRHSIPSRVISLLEDWGATQLFANISYEVDELRRDIKIHAAGKKANIKCDFIQDKLVVNPGILKTKNGRAYTVYSPWQRNWVTTLNESLEWIEEAPMPKANDKAIRSSGRFSGLFESKVPEFVDRFECADKDKMAEYWPGGTKVALQMLDRFLHTKARSSQIGETSPLSDGAEESNKSSRIQEYSTGRNLTDMDTTSRLSPYLASGVISARACIRATMKFLNCKNIEANRGNGVGMWVQEIAWRDFYNHVMVAFPRVSMGRSYLEKYADVKWETNEEHLQAWKDGKTGVPIVDAGMRQLNEFGWMHNRCRMIVAMYLTKDLMLDWRLGEKYFMENLIDGDLASNNGGWQWSASTGTDPQPYFRIFNPVSQSEKADPSGNYIRHYVPELRKLTGKVTMLRQSRWAPSQGTKSIHASGKIDVPDDALREPSSSKTVLPQPQNFSGWSDPALRLIDEEVNRMDIDSEASSGVKDSVSLGQIDLVVDTNVLLRYLDVLQQFAGDVDRVHFPISIIIPGIVVEELDYQKNDKSRQLCWTARMASTWILSKLKERRSVKGQAYKQTMQKSGSWKRRDPGTCNDDLIVDCCLFLREKQHHNVLAISQDNNLCTNAESQGILTLNPKTLTRWSSRSLARYLFGNDYPFLNEFSDYKETFRPRRVREALDDELGVPEVTKTITHEDDGMEVDDDDFILKDPPPQHLLDDLHDQVIGHFGILLSELLQRVAPASLFTQAPSKSGAASSIYASSSSCKPAKDWKANEILEYLCNARRVPRTASAADVKELTSDYSRMINFFTHKYDPRGRSGQHWSRADWVSCLEKLGVLGRAYMDDAILNSLAQLMPQLALVFETPMRPTGTGGF